MLNKFANNEWQYIAAEARMYASKAKSAGDAAEDGERWMSKARTNDITAQELLLQLYQNDENSDVENVIIQTELGGFQTIRVTHTDNSETFFNTDGEYNSSENGIDNEVLAYISGRIDESKNNCRVRRINESQLRRIVKESVKKILKEDVCFPDNLLGTNVTFDNNSTLVLICGHYHGRYEDDDCTILYYDISTKKFGFKGFTTRGGVSNEFYYDNYSYRDINDCDTALQEEIFEAAKEEAKKEDNKEKLMNKIKVWLNSLYDKSYSRKSVDAAIDTISQRLDEIIDNAPDIPTAISLFYDDDYCGYGTGKFRNQYLHKVLEKFQITIKDHIDRKIKLYGQDFTGKVIKSEKVRTIYGWCTKIGILPDGLGKSVWAYVNNGALKGDTITINGVISYETDRSITLSKAKRIDNVDPSLLVRVTSPVSESHNKIRISESNLRQMVSEAVRKILKERL